MGIRALAGRACWALKERFVNECECTTPVEVCSVEVLVEGRETRCMRQKRRMNRRTVGEIGASEA